MQKITNNYRFPLMLPMQLSKEVIFNEVIQKLDHLINCVVDGFIEKLSPNPLPHHRYIYLKEGDENHNCVCFYPNPAAGWVFHKPQEHMMLFCVQANIFLIYEDGKWGQYNPASETLNFVDKDVEDPFVKVEDSFVCTEDRTKFYLELTKDCEIDLSEVIFDNISIVFLQKQVGSCSVSWKLKSDQKIIWSNDKEYTGTYSPNQPDLVEFRQIVKPRTLFGKITSVSY